MKKCCSCHQEKPLDQFSNESRQRDGKKLACKSCDYEYQKKWRAKRPGYTTMSSKKWRDNNPQRMRDHNLKARLGLPFGTYDMMLESQDGRCAICKKPHTENKRMAVDHCHVTGEIRGLLCQKCNMALGLFNHDFAILHAAISYLDKIVVAGILANRAGPCHPNCKEPD